MMKTLLRLASLAAGVPGLLLCAQNVNSTQTLVTQGLLSHAGHGALRAAAYATDGTLILLADEHDGIRLLRGDASGTTLLNQAQVGATGDVPVSMALDPAGNIYVAGTSTGSSLSGSAGVAFPSRADTSTNSFLAKFDPGLHLVYLTFLGAGRTAVTGVAATADAAFVTGSTYSTSFPVTSAGIQQAPANGTLGNGFVERFSSSGALVYATYLTGVGGDTAPAGIVANASDDAFVAGATQASGYPTVNALQPRMLGSGSGFLTELTPGGEGFVFSTFIAGNGITSIARDDSTRSLLLTGNVSLGQFPVATAQVPLIALPYQVLLRLPEDGQTVAASVALAPGNTSFVAAGANGSAWVTGAVSADVLPGTTQPLSAAGDAFVLHVAADGTIDQTARLGGMPVNNAGYASVTTAPAAPAVAANGTTVAVPATVTLSSAASLNSTQRYDLPLVNAPNALLPQVLRDAAVSCASGQCSGTAGLLGVFDAATAQPSLGLTFDNTPNLTLRNLGSEEATGLTLTASGYAISGTDCSATLESSHACSVALSGTGPGTFTVSAANAPTETFSLPASSGSAQPLAVSTDALNFGIVTAGGPVSRSFTVTNLTGSAQTFTSGPERGPNTSYAVSATATDCTSNNGVYTVAARGACHFVVSVAASSAGASDGPIAIDWLVAGRDIALGGYAQSAGETLSATEIDFGTVFSGSASSALPRFLFVSNASPVPHPHTPVSVAASSPFSVHDECPSTLEPQSVCRITLNYRASAAPSADSTTLTVDGTSVLLTGTTLLPATVTGSATNPNLSVSPLAVVFSAPVTVTQVSGNVQTVAVSNTGATPLPLTIGVSGDFSFTTNCPAVLPARGGCAVLVSFVPAQPGVRDGLLSVTAGTGFAPTLVALSGTATGILPPNNGVLDLGQTYTGEPLVQWYKLQQSLPTLTAQVNDPAFGVALVQDTGAGHGTLPASAFTQTATGACGNCWLGVQFFAGTAGIRGATVSLSTMSTGNAETLALTATALPVQGLLLSPIAQDFGPLGVNSSSAVMTFTLSNLVNTAAAAQVRSITASGDFRVAPNSAGFNDCGASLAATASCGIGVIFAPSATGQRSGTLTIVTDQGTTAATLTGFGLADEGLALNPASLVFNNVPGSAATQQSIVLTNTSAVAESIGPVSGAGTAFQANSTCGTLAPGAVCTIAVTYVPGQAIASATLAIPVSSVLNGQTVNSVYYVPLNATYTVSAAGLLITPGIANFGSTQTSRLGLTREFTLSNFSTKTLDVSLNVPRQFPLADTNTCAGLAAGTSCVFSVSFLPSVSGEATGTIAAAGVPTDGSPAMQALAYMIGYGEGSGALNLSGSSLIPNSPLDFNTITSGQVQTATLTLTNTGLTPVTVRRVTSQPPFFSTSTCGSPLAANASCSIALTYAPVDELGQAGALRRDTGQLIVESDATVSPITLGLVGTVNPVITSSPASSAVLATYTLSESALTFSNTQVGDVSTAQSVTLTNTGTRALNILSVTAPSDFAATSTCTTLLAGQSCSIRVSFTPGGSATSNVRSGTLEIQTDGAVSLEYMTLLGASSPAPLTLTPSVLDFGTVNVGSSSTLNVSVRNTASTPITFSGATATSDYTVGRGTCPGNGATLAAGSSCSLAVTFSPTAPGTRTGTLSLSSDAAQTALTVGLTGVGALGHLTATPSALAFGAIAVGSPANLSLTLLNTGSAAVTGLSASVSGPDAADFGVTVPCTKTSLTPNQGCVLTVTFTPSRTTAEAATLTIASSDPASPLTIPLTGSGSQPGTFTLTVNGSSAATVTVKSGSPAAYTLLVTPLNGFTGSVALTCTPVNPAQYASCSLLAAQLSLANGSQTSMATINTITTVTQRLAAFGAALLFVPWWRRRTQRRWVARGLGAAMLLLVLAGLGACGGGGKSNVRTSPAGQYQWQVTASSTSGPSVSQTVNLYLNIQ